MPWEVSGSTFNLVTGLITVTASFPTIILNAFIILAIKQRRELQKPSNIMLSSLAVTDLLVGVILMPTDAAIDFFSLRQFSFEYHCMLHAVNHFFRPLLFTATMHHLTITAWERYVAIQKWKYYKLKITNGRLKKIAIGIWFSAILPTVASFTTTLVFADRTIMERILTGWIAVETVCLFLVAYFYGKVYLVIRNRKPNGISQIGALMKAKLESKIAKTTGLLTAAVISSFIPAFAFGILGHVFPVFRTNQPIRLIHIGTQLNSLFNPLLYCYRDHRFKKAIRELLGMKKSQALSPNVGDTQFIRLKDSVRSSELPIVGKHAQRLTRSASCNLLHASIHGTPSVVMLKKSLSAPTLYTRSSSLVVLDQKNITKSKSCDSSNNTQ